MKKSLIILAIVLSACTSLQTRSTATANLPGKNKPQAFDIAMHAAMASGLTVISASKETGLINATRGANPLLTWQNPAINILVTSEKTSSRITLGSTVGGQLIDYGTTSDTLDDFCNAILGAERTASCQVR